MSAAPTISQLQLRAFVIVVLIFVLTKVAYRVFIEQPNIEQTLSLLIKSDLDDIRHDAQRYLSRLEDTSYKLATSEQALAFLQQPSQDFIEAELSDEMFVELEVDGVIFIDEEFKTVYKKGLNHTTLKKIDYELDDFVRYPQHKKLFRPMESEGAFTPISGMIQTINGPAFFSAVQVKKPQQEIKNHGYLIFIRILGQSFLDHIAQDSYAKLSLATVPKHLDLTHLKKWTDVSIVGRQHPVNQLVIDDYFKNPINILTVTHMTSIVSPWLDERSMIYIGVLILLLLAWRVWAIKRIVLPIHALSAQIKAMSDNIKFQQLNENGNIAELNDFAKNFNQLTDTVKRQASKLNEQIYLDPLTQIANRRAFNQHLSRQISLLKRHNIGFCIVMADIDHFKRYNDSVGHLAGDDALVQVAKVLSSFFKRSSDICARFGGEEFIMLFSGVSIEFVEQQLANMLTALHDKDITHPDSPTAKYITLSLGACFVDGHKVDSKTLEQKSIIEIADKALYQSKEQGRNKTTIAVFS